MPGTPPRTPLPVHPPHYPGTHHPTTAPTTRPGQRPRRAVTGPRGVRQASFGLISSGHDGFIKHGN